MIDVDVSALARELGFHRVAVVPIEAPRRHAAYTSWLAAGHAGDMAYLAEPDHVAPRADLRAVFAAARSLVVVALAYPRDAPLAPDSLVPALRGRIARYARGEDYHLVLRDRLVALADRLAAALGSPVAARPCVDSAPVLERDWAERGGLGFVAKNTMLIAPGLGSYVVLGELLVDADLTPTAPETPPRPRCGSCRACLDACPTRAFVDAYTLDARRCISYLTIEHHGPIPRELRPAIGTWVFGCDICQEVCPFNAGAGEPPDPGLAARDLEHSLPDLVALATTNTGDPRAIEPLVALLAHRAAIVRLHAAWALGHLGALAPLHARAAIESDPGVVAEIDHFTKSSLAT